jgi:hypothetical protein
VGKRLLLRVNLLKKIFQYFEKIFFKLGYTCNVCENLCHKFLSVFYKVFFEVRKLRLESEPDWVGDSFYHHLHHCNEGLLIKFMKIFGASDAFECLNPETQELDHMPANFRLVCV